MLGKLFSNCRSVPEEYKYKNKYCYLAVCDKLYNYRLCSLSDVIRSGVDTPQYLREFINKYGEVLVVANPMGGVITQLYFRSYTKKDFSVFGDQASIPYGLGLMDPNFKYGDPVVVVEGQADRDLFRRISPNVVATLSAGLSKTGVKVLGKFTNRLILAYDNDKSGIESKRRDFYALRGKEFIVDTLEMPKMVKDFGDIAELQYSGKMYEYDYAMLEVRSNYNAMVSKW